MLFSCVPPFKSMVLLLEADFVSCTAQMYFRHETHLHCSASFVAFRIFYYFRKALVFSASNRRRWGSGAFFLRPAVQVHGFVIGGRFRFLLRANVFLTRNSSPLQGFLPLTCQALSSQGGRVSSLQNCIAILQSFKKSMEGLSRSCQIVKSAWMRGLAA